MSLEEKILKQYEKNQSGYGQLPYSPYAHHICNEREKWYKKLLTKKFNSLNEIDFLEVGAGAGDNLFFFQRAGVYPERIFANELVPDRVGLLERHWKKENLLIGNFLELETSKSFDMIFQSTVFSSILSPVDKQIAADKMKSMLKPGGVILWYDFTFDSPTNKSVKGIKKAEIRKLFHDSKNIKFKRVTLVPPLARRVKGSYPFFNFLFPFLRTHVIALIEY